MRKTSADFLYTYILITFYIHLNIQNENMENSSSPTRIANPSSTTSNTAKNSSKHIDENYTSDFEDEEDDVNGVIHIGHGIVINGPLNVLESLNGLKASKLTPEKRNKKISIVNIPKDINFASDIFILSIETAENIGSEKELQQGNKCIELKKNNGSQIRFKVPITCVRNSKLESVLNEYSAWINDVIGWKLTPASYNVGKMADGCLILYDNIHPNCGATIINIRKKIRSSLRKVEDVQGVIRSRNSTKYKQYNVKMKKVKVQTMDETKKYSLKT